MKKLVLLILFMVPLFFPAVSKAGAPKSIVGITLGSNINENVERIEMHTAMPIWRSEYLSRASLKPVKGFESGYIVYGNCKVPGRIIRIKLNYENDTREFFEKLFSTLTKRHGKPSEWRGNPFGTLKVWKWSFKDEEKNSISMILQRYEGEDDAFTPGNSIKIAVTTYAEEEEACYKADSKGKKAKKPIAGSEDKLDLNWYLPQ